ncbi:MAG: DegT/DnrJ/EryC1/StrS family aminotransferase [Candidatus Omnitrophica bacterium]|nr:DegT/DnrJ/EryC1/StrS family aminotransferase [Candidatus Omnitrophota bacterium]
MRKVELGYLKVSATAKRYVNDVLDSNRLSTGPYIRRFEKAFAAEHDCADAVMCNSGTSALQIALAALKVRHGWKDGDEVLVPAITWIATSNIVLQNQMRPVFVDPHPATYNIDPAQLEKHLTPRTRAILPAHLFGLPCDMDPILDFAKKHRLEVLEDSCETMFVRYHGKKVGSFGALGCFSTYVAHLLVTGVGGLVTARDAELGMLCRSIMAHGRDSIYLSIDDDDKIRSDDFRIQMIQRRFSMVRMGYSYRATELEGALGLAALEEKDAMMKARKENAAYLTRVLQPLAGHLQLPTVPAGHEHAFMMYPVVLRAGIERDIFLNHLESRGIETRYMMPLLNQPFYRKIFGPLEENYPVARQINAQGFYIGCHQGLVREDMDYVAEVFRRYFQQVKPAGAR